MSETISVLIPTYNREKYIGACLSSIFDQTYHPIQVIVYDDGSEDRTLDIVRSFPNIRIIEGKTNRGVSYARNQLLQACPTRLAAWQDSDDLSNKYRLEEQYQALTQSGATLVFSYCSRLHQSGIDAWKKEPTADPRHNTQCFAGILFDRQKTGDIFFNEEVNLGGEDLLWIKAVEKATGARISVPKQLYYVRFHPDRIGQWKRKAANRLHRQKSDEAYHREMEKYRQ